jgi:hypothetical protein
VDNVSLISPSIYFSLPSDSNLRLVVLLVLYLPASPIYHPERKLTATHRSSAGTSLLRSLSARPSSPFLTHVIAQVCWVGVSLCFVDLGLERLRLRARVSEAQGALAVGVSGQRCQRSDGYFPHSTPPFPRHLFPLRSLLIFPRPKY